MHHVFLFLAAQTSSAFADDRSQPSEHHEHQNPHENGHGHGFELGFSPGVAYLPEESEFAFALHVHFLAALGDSPWALGVGVERVFDEHAHNSAGLLLQYRVFDAWSIALGPGVSFDDEGTEEMTPTLHLETAYEFALGDFHVGPLVEAAVDRHHLHLTLGMHLAIGF